jgi:hypothetical protein
MLGMGMGRMARRWSMGLGRHNQQGASSLAISWCVLLGHPVRGSTGSAAELVRARNLGDTERIFQRDSAGRSGSRH